MDPPERKHPFCLCSFACAIYKYVILYTHKMTYFRIMNYDSCTYMYKFTVKYYTFYQQSIMRVIKRVNVLQYV